MQATRYTVVLVMAHCSRITTSDLKHHVKEIMSCPFGEEMNVEASDSESSAKTKKLRDSDFKLLDSIQTDERAMGVCSIHIVDRISKAQADRLHLDVGLICSSSAPQIIWALFVAQHPAFGIVSISIFTTSSMQASIFTCAILGPAMVAALFFSVTGQALSVAAASECAVEGARKFWRGIAVGFFSWFASSLPLLLAQTLVKHYFVQKEHWDERSKRWWIKSWAIQDAVIYYGLIVYSLACILYVLVFLANVQNADQDLWIVSYATFLIEDFVLIPLICTLILFFMSVVVRRCNPEMLEKIIEDLQVVPDLDLEEFEKSLTTAGFASQDPGFAARRLEQVKDANAEGLNGTNDVIADEGEPESEPTDDVEMHIPRESADYRFITDIDEDAQFHDIDDWLASM